MDERNRRRLQAVLIAAIFVVPVLVALVLGLTGWIPRGHSYGQPIQPERNLAQVDAQLANGNALAWTSHDARWTLVALPGPACGDACLGKLDLIHRARIGLGRHADNVRLVYLGTPPTGAAAAGFERVWTLATTSSHALDDLRATAPDSVSAVLVSPAGEALTRYPAPIDVARLGDDLQRVLRR